MELNESLNYDINVFPSLSSQHQFNKWANGISGQDVIEEIYKTYFLIAIEVLCLVKGI